MSILDWAAEKFREAFGPPDPPDSREQLKDILERLRRERGEAKIRAADAIRDFRSVARERDDCRARVAQAEHAAEQAAGRGQEARFRQLVEDKLHATRSADALDEQCAELDRRVQDLRQALDTYGLEIERAERDQRTWEMRERTARLRSDTHRDVSSSALAEARSLLEHSEESARREEAKAEVRERVSRSQREAAPKQRRVETEVDREMARIRRRLEAPSKD
jgi:phage shock protein A